MIHDLKKPTKKIFICTHRGKGGRRRLGKYACVGGQFTFSRPNRNYADPVSFENCEDILNSPSHSANFYTPPVLNGG